MIAERRQPTDIAERLEGLRRSLDELAVLSELQERELRFVERAAQQLDGVALRLLVHVRRELSFTEFRRVKQELVARELKVNQSSVARAFGKLLAEGYLVEQEEPGRASLFRIQPMEYWAV